jgi:hypothetical protein
MWDFTHRTSPFSPIRNCQDSQPGPPNFSRQLKTRDLSLCGGFGLASALDGNAQEHYSTTSIAGELFLARQATEQFRFRFGEKYADSLFGFGGDR